MIKHTSEESKSSLMFSPTYLNEDSFTPLSPLAFFDESNRKVNVLASSDSNKKVPHERFNKKVIVQESNKHGSWE